MKFEQRRVLPHDNFQFTMFLSFPWKRESRDV